MEEKLLVKMHQENCQLSFVICTLSQIILAKRQKVISLVFLSLHFHFFSMSIRNCHRSERQRAKDAKIEALRSRGTLLPMDEPVDEDLPPGVPNPNSRLLSDSTRLHFVSTN